MPNVKANPETVAEYLWGLATGLSANAPQSNSSAVKLGSAMLDAVDDDIKELIRCQDVFQDEKFALKFFNANKKELAEMLSAAIELRTYDDDANVLRSMLDTEASDEELLDIYNQMPWMTVSSETDTSDLRKKLAIFAVDNAVYESVSAFRVMQDMENHMSYDYDDSDYRI